jgi:hypothetical protein
MFWTVNVARLDSPMKTPAPSFQGKGVVVVPVTLGWAVGADGGVPPVPSLLPQPTAARASADKEEKAKTRMCMGETLPAPSRARQTLAWVVLLPLVWVLNGCSTPQDDFVGARVLDLCNSSWPVCDGYASCLMGEASYTQGNLPGSGQIIVETLSASNITLSFLLSDLTAAGGDFSLVWWEPGCTAAVRTTVTGQVVAAESQAVGVFARTAQLNVAGYHLVTFQSTTQASYLLKVDVTDLNE